MGTEIIIHQPRPNLVRITPGRNTYDACLNVLFGKTGLHRHTQITILVLNKHMYYKLKYLHGMHINRAPFEWVRLFDGEVSKTI